MTPPLKTEGEPGRCRARYSMTEPYWMRAAIDGTNAFQLLLAAATSIPPAFHPPPNVFGRCVDDSCHAAGLELAADRRRLGIPGAGAHLSTINFASIGRRDRGENIGDANSLHAEVIPARGLAVIERIDAGAAGNARVEHTTSRRTGGE